MSWVSINEDGCTVCGTCVERCACFSEKDGKSSLRPMKITVMVVVIVYPFVPQGR